MVFFNGFEFGDSIGMIIEYTGSDTNVVIPAMIDGKQVTAIGGGAFHKCTNITSVTIPSGVISIGESAFSFCTNLISVTIPSGVISIGKEAFLCCRNLTSINIPSSVTTIGKDAFDDCNSLDSASREAIWQRSPKKGGCYVATAVYGSYDCPQVWTLRRYRDLILAESLFGRTFIRTYYTVSPTMVKWFGKKAWFNHLWRNILDRKIEKLRKCGINDTPYADRVW